MKTVSHRLSAADLTNLAVEAANTSVPGRRAGGGAQDVQAPLVLLLVDLAAREAAGEK
jgi:hypothetical protein